VAAAEVPLVEGGDAVKAYSLLGTTLTPNQRHVDIGRPFVEHAPDVRGRSVTDKRVLTTCEQRSGFVCKWSEG
jgi:hypothetical protein